MNWLLRRRRDLRDLPGGGVQDRRRQRIEQVIGRRKENENLLELVISLKNSYSHIISKFDDNTTNVVKRSNNNVKKGNKVELLHSFFSKDAMKSFYLLNNGKFQEAILSQFRAGLQIGMFVDVYDTESSTWRLGTVKLLNGPEQKKVIALYGFNDRFDISLNRLFTP